MKNIYLDNSATTKTSDDAITEMTKSLSYFGNPSSLHSQGHHAMRLIEEARKNVATLINADPIEIIFTSGGTESNNTIINIAKDIIQKNPEKNEVIVSSIEHPSILEATKRLELSGVKVTYIPVDRYGKINIDAFKKALNYKTALVSVMHANNETGVIQDINEISRLAHNFNILVHTDAVQTIGKIDFNVDKLNVDYATFSAHKIYGPKGVGALYIRNKSSFSPLIIGGHQEKGKRSGTYNTPGIVGFGVAAKNAIKSKNDYKENIQFIKNKLRQEIIDKIPNVIVNGDQDQVLPNVLNVSFPGAEGESIILYLDNFGIQASTGSACAAGDTKPSHVLMAMLDDPELAHGSVRFSFGLDNEISDVDYVMKYLPKIIKNLREMSTIGLEE